MRRVSLSLVVLLVLTVLSLPVMLESILCRRDKDVEELIEELSETRDIEVILQFNGPSSSRLWQALESKRSRGIGRL